MANHEMECFLGHGKGFITGLILFAAGFLFSCTTGPSGFPIRRGINISHWLSQSGRRGADREAFFTRRDVEYLAGLGYDHLRIPVDEEQLWNETGEKEEEAFRLLHQALDWCAEFRLRAVVDLHILRSHHFNAEEKPLWTEPSARERFIDCWRELSSSLKNRPVAMVAYELMNEPVADDPEDWNRLVAKAMKAVRALEPDRVIVIGSNRWQSVHTFDQLAVPENDPNIILSFHFYEPFLLTHHQAGWTGIRDYRGTVRYPGRTVEEKDLTGLSADLVARIERYNGEFDRSRLEAMLEKPLALSRRTGLPLYCGEWGCYREAPEEDALRWYRDLRSLFDEHGIAFATWDYKGGFGIIKQNGRPYEKLIEILTGRNE